MSRKSLDDGLCGRWRSHVAGPTPRTGAGVDGRAASRLRVGATLTTVSSDVASGPRPISCAPSGLHLCIVSIHDSKICIPRRHLAEPEAGRAWRGLPAALRGVRRCACPPVRSGRFGTPSCGTPSWHAPSLVRVIVRNDPLALLLGRLPRRDKVSPWPPATCVDGTRLPGCRGGSAEASIDDHLHVRPLCRGLEAIDPIIHVELFMRAIQGRLDGGGVLGEHALVLGDARLLCLLLGRDIRRRVRGRRSSPRRGCWVVPARRLRWRWQSSWR